jgi:hypothetical protein
MGAARSLGVVFALGALVSNAGAADAPQSEIAKPADGITSPQSQIQQLEAKRKELDRLAAEIAALERATGINRELQVSATMYEVPASFLKTLAMEGPLPDDQPSPEAPIPLGLLKKPVHEKDVVAAGGKVLAAPSLIVNNGRPATLVAGGSFPIVVPQKESRATVQYRDFGTRMEVVASSIGSNRYRLQTVVEYSDRFIEKSFEVDGYAIPGVVTRRVNSEFEISAGEVMAVAALDQAKQKTEEADETPRKVTLVLLTAKSVAPAKVAATRR